MEKQFKKFRRVAIAEMRDYEPEEDLTGISISPEDTAAGSPKKGDMIARNPFNHRDQWLVSADYFSKNFEPMEQDEPMLAAAGKTKPDVVDAKATRPATADFAGGARVRAKPEPKPAAKVHPGSFERVKD